MSEKRESYKRRLLSPEENRDPVDLPNPLHNSENVAPEASETCLEEAVDTDAPSTSDTSDEDVDEKEYEPLTRGQRIKKIVVRTMIILIFLLVVMIGCMIIFYPQISNFINTKNQSRVIANYDRVLSEMSEEDYTEYLEAARAYNARLAGSGSTIRDAFTDALGDVDKTDEYWTLLDVTGNGMMGYIDIEDVGISLAIYHGTSEVVLVRGAGHIQGTSLPVGGEDTHAVISAHTGLPSARLFTDVDGLKVGNTFTLTVLKEVLTYEVDLIQIVLPSEVDPLSIEPGKDYVTLVTCTPYGVNSHRLFIRAKRIETPPSEDTAQQGEPGAQPKEETEPGWIRRAMDSIVEFFSIIVERVAEFLVNVTEWGIDLFGIEF